MLREKLATAQAELSAATERLGRRAGTATDDVLRQRAGGDADHAQDGGGRGGHLDAELPAAQPLMR